MRDLFERISGNPWLWVVFACAAAGIGILIGGLLWSVGAGFLIKAAQALGALVVAMAMLWGARRIRGLAVMYDPALDRIAEDPLALAVNRGLLTLAVFLLAGLVLS